MPLQAAIVERKSSSQTASLTTVLATTEAIVFEGAAGGGVLVPTGSAITTLTYHISHDGVTYLPLYTEDGATAVTQTVAGGRAYPLRGEAFAARFLKLVADAAGDVFVTMKG